MPRELLCANLATRCSELSYNGALQWLQPENPVVQEVVESGPRQLGRAAAAHVDVAGELAAAALANLRAAERARARARAVDAAARHVAPAEVLAVNQARVNQARARAAEAAGAAEALQLTGSNALLQESYSKPLILASRP